uniref:Uncharacterized protein n=1 Tax=Oryza meridionalis TaxID=40149 RepID=A0A0E0C134_9ORYZ
MAKCSGLLDPPDRIELVPMTTGFNSSGGGKRTGWRQETSGEGTGICEQPATIATIASCCCGARDEATRVK